MAFQKNANWNVGPLTWSMPQPASEFRANHSLAGPVSRAHKHSEWLIWVKIALTGADSNMSGYEG